MDSLFRLGSRKGTNGVILLLNKLIVVIVIMIVRVIAIVIEVSRRGTNGVSTNGVTANLRFFAGGTFWVLPLTYFYIPKSARAHLFPPICQNPLLLQRPQKC